MIASCRIDQAANEVLLSEGITAWMRGDEGPTATAAARIVGETIIMWRKILDSKLQR